MCYVNLIVTHLGNLVADRHVFTSFNAKVFGYFTEQFDIFTSYNDDNIAYIISEWRNLNLSSIYNDESVVSLLHLWHSWSLYIT